MLFAEMEKMLPGLVRQVLGPRAEIERSTVLKRQEDSLVVLLRIRELAGNIVVKLAGPEAPNLSAFNRSAAILKQVATGTSIQLPEILGVDVSYRDWPWRYLVTTYLEGEEWATARRKMGVDERRKAYAQIGEAVGQLHSIHYAAFGEIDPAGEVQNGQPLVAALLERAKLILKSQRSLELFLALLERERKLFEGARQASLCHEDLHKYNILFAREPEGWRLKTILDFDKAWAGHAESDLARMSFWRGMTAPEFWTAYREQQAIEDDFERRQEIYQLLWCLEYASTSAKHVADTKRVCEGLGVSFSGKF